MHRAESQLICVLCIPRKHERLWILHCYEVKLSSSTHDANKMTLGITFKETFMLCGIDPRKHVSLSSIVGKDIDILLYRISYGSILCRSSNVNFQPLDCILIASCMNCFSCSFSFEKEDEIAFSLNYNLTTFYQKWLFRNTIRNIASTQCLEVMVTFIYSFIEINVISHCKKIIIDHYPLNTSLLKKKWVSYRSHHYRIKWFDFSRESWPIMKLFVTISK